MESSCWLLHLGMPHLDGVQGVEALRGWTTAPIIVVSGRTGSADKVEALDAGTDDNVTKPFQTVKLLARLSVHARRSLPSSGEAVARFGDVEVELAARTVLRAGTRVHLTPTEWQILKFLARNPGSLVIRQTLSKGIWASEQGATRATYACTCRRCVRSWRPIPREPGSPVDGAGHGLLAGDAGGRSSRHPRGDITKLGHPRRPELFKRDRHRDVRCYKSPTRTVHPAPRKGLRFAGSAAPHSIGRNAPPPIVLSVNLQ